MDRNTLARALRDRAPVAMRRRLGVDARALAALRVSLALLLLADLLVRSRDLVAFYTDDGVLPRATLAEAYPAFASASLHAFSGAAWYQGLLFVVAGVLAVALLLGYRTTLVTAASFLLLASLHARNPILLNGGDSLLRRLLFWGMFLPLGGRWSVDALRREARGGQVASVATAAVLIQVVIVYTVNGIFKLRSDLWLSGDALRVVLGIDQLTVLLGDTLAQYPTLLGVLDLLWLAMTVGSVLLIVLTGRARALLVALFVAMHLGMLLTMRLGLFPLISVAALLPFLPPTVWDAVENRLADPVRWVSDATARVVDPSSDGRRPAFGRGGIRVAASRWKRRLAPPLVATLLALILVWNAATLGYVAAPDAVTAAVNPNEHRWDMFAPDPRDDDGWYVVPATTRSGEEVDAFHRSDLDWDRPPDLASTFPSHRWFVYLVDLSHPTYAYLRPAFADYLCQRWNDEQEDDLVDLAIHYVEVPVRLDGSEERRTIELYSGTCAPGTPSRA